MFSLCLHHNSLSIIISGTPYLFPNFLKLFCFMFVHSSYTILILKDVCFYCLRPNKQPTLSHLHFSDVIQKIENFMGHLFTSYIVFLTFFTFYTLFAFCMLIRLYHHIWILYLFPSTLLPVLYHSSHLTYYPFFFLISPTLHESFSYHFAHIFSISPATWSNPETFFLLTWYFTKQSSQKEE